MAIVLISNGHGGQWRNQLCLYSPSMAESSKIMANEKIWRNMSNRQWRSLAKMANINTIIINVNGINNLASFYCSALWQRKRFNGASAGSSAGYQLAGSWLAMLAAWRSVSAGGGQPSMLQLSGRPSSAKWHQRYLAKAGASGWLAA